MISGDSPKHISPLFVAAKLYLKHPAAASLLNMMTQLLTIIYRLCFPST